MNRRAFLRRASAAAATLALAPQRAFASPGAGRIVDTHTHFYDPPREGGVPWPNKTSKLYRRVLPQDFLAVAGSHGIRETVVVEASGWLEDNAWILELAAREPSIIGFVGNLTPQDVDFPKHLERFAAHPLFRGVRVSSGALLANIDKPEFRRGLGLMIDRDLQLDVIGPPTILLSVARLAGEMSSLRIVIDQRRESG